MIKFSKINFWCIVLFISALASCGNPGMKGTNGEGDGKDDMSIMTEDTAFRDIHEIPEELTKIEFKGEMAVLPVPGGEDGRAYLLQRPEIKDKYLFIFHEWWGLNDHIKKTAEQYFDSIPGINVMAIDLYDGEVAKTREEASALVQNMNEERGRELIRAALTLVGKDAEIATIGWCFGGGWSLKAALQARDRAEGCVMFYGMPVQDAETLEKLECDVLFVWAKKDEWINVKVVEEFKFDMAEAGKDLEVISYEADHAFANPSSSSYKKDAAKDATKKAVNFLRDKL